MPAYLRFFLIVSILAFDANSAPRVSLPNGELVDSNVDIRVKVMGGQVAVRRTWTNGRWYFNPLWADLKFKIDNTSGEAEYVDRAGTVFERTGNGDVYRFDSHQFIRREAINGEWRWYDRMGNYALYTQTGVLREYADKNGVSVTIESNAENRPITIKGHFGNDALVFTYTNEKLSRVTDRTGRFVEYSWVGSQLREVRDLLGHTWSYEYDSNGQLTTVTDPELRVTTAIYAQSFEAGEIAAPLGISFTGRPGRDFRISRVASMEDPMGRVTRYEYEYSRDRREFTAITITPEPINRTLERVYDIEGRLLRSIIGSEVIIERRADGPLIDYDKNERGLVTRTERDVYRNVVQVQHPDGTQESWKYLPALSHISEYTNELGVKNTYDYDPNGRLLRSSEAVGTQVERTVELAYTEYGQVEMRTLKGATADADVVTEYEYDEYGSLTKTTDAEQHVTLRTYDVMGNMLTLTDENGNVSTMTYTDAGSLESSRSPMQFATNIEHDKVQNSTKVIRPIDGSRTSETFFRRDHNGRTIEIEDALGGVTKQTFDEEGRIVETEDARGVTNRTEYDSRGRPISQTDGNGNVVETIYGDETDALEGLVARRVFPTYEETYKYDQRDREIESQQILNSNLQYTNRKSFDAVGNVISITDAKGRTTQRYFDPLRRLEKEVDPISGQTLFIYDNRDNLLAVTDANGNTHRFTYDKINRKTSESRPMGQTIDYDYDAAGNLIERRNPNGTRKKLTYDDDNRMVLEEHLTSDPPVVTKSITKSYDQRGLLLTYDDGLTSGAYVYDDKGQVVRETVTFGAGSGAFSKTLERTYEQNGLLRTLTYPGTTGSAIYNYDSNNQLSTYIVPGLAEGNNILIYDYRWSAIEQVTLPGNLTRTVNLDDLLRPERIQISSSSGGSNSIFDSAYVYDEVDNLISKTTPDGMYVYEYDQLDRLITVVPPAALRRTPENPSGLPREGYTYDGVDNRLTSEHQAGPWIYNANNELTLWGTDQDQRAIRYDSNGSIVEVALGSTSVRLREYLYDSEDRVREVLDDGQSIARYAYDPMGRRIWRETIGAIPEVTWFLYSKEGLVAEYSDVGNAIREYGWNAAGRWSIDVVWQKDNSGVYIATNDYLMVTDTLTTASDGAVAWSAVREGFGAPRVAPASLTQFLLRYPGQLSDETVGLNYNLFRDYDATTGRYMTSDPIGLGGGLSTYGYAMANPNSKLDPTGLVTWTGRINYAQIAAGLRGFSLLARRKVDLSLESECIEGRKMIAGVVLTGWSGPGASWEAFLGTATLSDGSTIPDESNLVGHMRVSGKRAGRFLSGGVSSGMARGRFKADGFTGREFDMEGENELKSLSGLWETCCPTCTDF